MKIEDEKALITARLTDALRAETEAWATLRRAMQRGAHDSATVCRLTDDIVRSNRLKLDLLQQLEAFGSEADLFGSCELVHGAPGAAGREVKTA